MNIIKYSCHVGNRDNPIKDDRVYVKGSDKFKSDRMNAKVPKVLPHLYLGNHDYSIWIDANLELLVSNEDLISLLGDDECMVFKHPYRKTINEEIKACKHLDSVENINYHANKEGVLAACGIIVRKNTEIVNSLNEKWWVEICAGSSRDQLSFPYTLGTIAKYIETEWIFPFHSKYVRWHKHKTN